MEQEKFERLVESINQVLDRHVEAFPVVIFNDDSVLPLSEFRLMSNPDMEARLRGGICEKKSVDSSEFEDLLDRKPGPEDISMAEI